MRAHNLAADRQSKPVHLMASFYALTDPRNGDLAERRDLALLALHGNADKFSLH